MGELYRYKCKGCGYTIHSSKDGDYCLIRGRGHYYLCPRCKDVFRKNWSYGDIDLNSKDYSYEKDNHLADLLAKGIPKELQEEFKKDVLWFQDEVLKGDESHYYGKTLTHDAVNWTKEVFWEKLFKFLKRKKYAKSINVEEFRRIVKDPHFEKIAKYTNCVNNVKCNHCEGQVLSWSPIDGCPKCGNILELEPNRLILVD